MNYKNNSENKVPKGYIICDLDGTLSNISSRLHYLEEEPKNWKSFFSEIENDTPDAEVHGWLREFIAHGYAIAFVSARPESTRGMSEAWLTAHCGDVWRDSKLYLRANRDHRPDHIVKREMINKHFRGRPVWKVLEDRPMVVQMYRDLGFSVIDVGEKVKQAV